MPKGRKGRWRRICWFLTGFLAAYVAGCYYLARVYLSPLRRTYPTPQGLARVTIPDVGTSRDPAWCTPHLAAGHPSQVVFVFAHGHGGSLRAFSHLMLDLAGHNIDAIEPSMPGQDDNPQKDVGFGTKEAMVMLRAADWVRERRPVAKIIYAGVSMGGAAAWLASQADPAGAGVVSEAAFANFPEAINTSFAHAAPGADIYLHPVIWIASRISGIRPENIRPLEAARAWKGRPALVIEGSDDTTIPVSHARRLAEASGAALWIIPGAAHANGYDTARPEYLAHILAFADQVRKAPIRAWTHLHSLPSTKP